MLLEPQEVEDFFRLHRTLMHFVNGRLGVLPQPIQSPEEFSAQSPTDRCKVREALLGNLDLIDAFAAENNADLTAEDLEIVRSWRHLVSGRFFIFRELKQHTVFLTAQQPIVAYGVYALTEPFEDVICRPLPIMVETVLLPFRGKIVYDGILNGFNISFGPGVLRSLNDNYREAKASQGIVASLPMENNKSTPRAQKSQPVARKKKPAAPKDDAGDIAKMIISMTDQFCVEHLNDEYAELCRKLTEKLARKRPSPLLSGKPNTWAAGIVRTIGWVNYLDDSDNEPHMKLTAIDKAFGVGESTGQGKSKLIRSMLKIRPFDHQWTLPSRLDDNPMVWMLTVNGFPVDIRQCPREAQEMAFEKGLIPYIPADRE